MIKVTVVVPHPDLRPQAEKALAEYAVPGVEYEIIHAYGTRVEIMPVGGADIILARGLTQQALKRKFPDSAVLELTVSAYDLIRAIHECRKSHQTNRVAIIGSDTILHDVETLKELSQADLRIFKVRNEGEIIQALAEAGRDGFDAVVGGLTACKLAEERGWRTCVIRTSDETLQVSIKEAMNTASVMQSERAKAEISRAILQNSKEAILYFDRSGVLAQFNRRVFETLNLPPQEGIAGRKAEDLFIDAGIVELVRGLREAHGIIKSVNHAMLISDFVPVRVEGEAIGIICTFQRINEIQAAETRIRKELHKKGLIAKYGFTNIIHASPGLSQTIATAHKYAGVDANVLLVGETGTGKELFAQSIHNASTRRLEPFVAVNCAAFPENLLESELFGYVEGAFSGAARGGRTGLFELAHGGTMFLDEIGEIPFNLQASLLRALQEGEIRRIGDDRVIPVNVRIIAATNKDLREKVAAGQFRMDLLYRLDVLSLSIPPLRERREDIGHIADYYLQRYCLKYRKPSLRLTPAALATLEKHDWPGNTRELRNVCERLAVLGEDRAEVDGDEVAGILNIAAILPKEGADDAGAAAAGPENLEDLVRFADSLRVNKADIATMLGISRTTLWRRMKAKERAK